MRLILILLPALLLAADPSSAPKKVSPASPASAKLAPATVASAPVKNFHESGSATAPITFELYTDYECPACRDFYLNVLPSLTNDFVKTGKVRLVHRDFPLPQHQYSKLATRYANAAGTIGKYDVVATQIFQSQPIWEQNGQVDSEVSKVLSPADMQKVRDLVKNDAHLDDSVTKDVALGQNDIHLQVTPTLVIITNKDQKKDVIGGGMPYGILKSYLNKKLGE
jgi:protein-disulfide isomerase